MGNDQNARVKQGEESLRDVVNRTLTGAGITRITDRKGYEVHPTLPWPLPRNGFRCRFLGVDPEMLSQFDISPNQHEVEVRCEDLLWLSRVALKLADKTPYKLGGYWHLAMSRSKLTDGANQQRMILYAMTQAAKRDLCEMRLAMENGRDLSIHIPTKAWASKIAPLEGTRNDERDDEWNRLVLGRTDHWVFGMNIQSQVIHEEITPLDIFGKVETMRTGNLGAAIRTAFSLRPVGLAFAIGFRGKVNAAAGTSLLDDRSPEEFHAWIWELNESCKRLLTHIITCPTSATTDGSGFQHLDDPWKIAAILGSDIQEMTKNNKKDLRKRLRESANLIIQSAPPRFKEYVESCLKGVLSTGAGKVPFTGMSMESIEGVWKPHPSDEFELLGELLSEDGLETTPPGSGNHTPNLWKAHPQPLETTPRRSGNRTPSGRVNAESIFDSPLFKKEEKVDKDKIKTLGAESTESADEVEGLLNINFNENKKDQKLPMGAESENTENTPAPESALGEVIREDKKWSITEVGSRTHKAVLPNVDTTPLPAVTKPIPEKTPVPAALPGVLVARPVDSGKVTPFRGIVVADLTGIATMTEYAAIRGMVRREGVAYTLPGRLKPTTGRYQLPEGSMVPKTWEAPWGDILDGLKANPELAARFPSDLIERINHYKPTHETTHLSVDEIMRALSSAPASMTANHVENLLRVIDTAPDDLVESKVEALRTALTDKHIANMWFRWGKNLDALAGWESFTFCDPFIAHAAASWRSNAKGDLAGNEMVARHYADWWRAVNIRPRLLPTAPPIDTAGLRDALHQAILDAIPEIEADRIIATASSTLDGFLPSDLPRNTICGSVGQQAMTKGFRDAFGLDIDGITERIG